MCMVEQIIQCQLIGQHDRRSLSQMIGHYNPQSSPQLLGLYDPWSSAQMIGHHDRVRAAMMAVIAPLTSQMIGHNQIWHFVDEAGRFTRFELGAIGHLQTTDMDT